MSGGVRVFVNERGVTAPPGATVLDAVRALDPALADAVRAGVAWVTDGVGRPLDATQPVEPGAIVRAAARARRGPAAPE
jgi:hypothetical protein